MKIKKIFFTALLICFLLVINTVAFASDIALDVIDGEHAYLVLATISDIDEIYVTAEFYNTLNETEEQIPSSIKIEKFRYSYCSEHADSSNNPKIGDNIFIVLDKAGDVYKSSVAYKTDTVDVRTLNLLVPSAMENQECMTDVAAIAYYIRTGGINTSFAFADNTVSIIQDGTEHVIYPTDAKTPVGIKYVTGQGKTIDSQKQQDVISVNPMFPEDMAFYKEMIFGKRVVALGIVFAGVILGMLVMYFTAMGRKRN